MPNIFELVQSNQITAYWETLAQDAAPFIGEELFPSDKKRGLSIKWLKGSRGLPVVLKTSPFDAPSIPRSRIGFDGLAADMPFFKESMYIDEELRQELNMVLETGNQAYIDTVINQIFDDEMRLLDSARVARERMRMMALTTGIVSMTSNGQVFSFDYGVTHKDTVSASWSDRTNSDPIEDIREAKEKILDDTGAVITRAICDGATFRNIRNNDKVKKAIFVLTNGSGAVSDTALKNYLMDELEIEVVINDKRYKDENGSVTKYVPADTFVLFPAGALGKTWFGTTPAESDLMGSGSSNVSITDSGVSVLTAKHEDPVQVETIVSMICLPSFEQADQIFILDTAV